MNRTVLGNLAVILALVALGLGLGLWQTRSWGLASPLPAQWAVAGVSLLLYAGLCLALWRARRQPATTAAPATGQWLVAWASQTGTATELAQRSAAALMAGGQPARVLPLEQLDNATLATARGLLVVAATTGEGDAPDHAQAIDNGLLRQAASLPGLPAAVLALGDRDYSEYCAFGLRIGAWLQLSRARLLAPVITVNREAPADLAQWQTLLAGLGAAEAAPLTAPAAQPWRLQQRQLLNPGSQGGPVYHLQLAPVDGALPAWEAGDIALVTPQHAPAQVAQWLASHGLDGTQLLDNGLTLADHLATVQLPQAVPAGNPPQWAPGLPALTAREYSIASMPSEGHLALLLRRHTGPDGHPGLGSGWLCDVLQPGQPTALRLRRNPGFHPPANDVPLVLIGNGTGIAGLRAQLRARIDAGPSRNWLLFGERSRECDYHFGQELERWYRDGQLERLDVTFSRDGGTHRHVQHALAAQADELKAWLDAGAVLMVCGSLKGMAPDVDAVIVQVLGQEGRDALLAEGRYRRDVY